MSTTAVPPPSEPAPAVPYGPGDDVTVSGGEDVPRVSTGQVVGKTVGKVLIRTVLVFVIRAIFRALFRR